MVEIAELKYKNEFKKEKVLKIDKKLINWAEINFWMTDFL